MKYAGFFSKLDTTKVPTLNVTLKAEDNASFNCDNMFAEGKFNVINFNKINGVNTDSIIASFSSKNIFKTTTSNTLNFTIDNVICENVDLSSAFEDATIENLTFTTKNINNGYKMFKNAKIGTVTKLNIEKIKNGNEAFADSTITTIGTAEGQGINLTNTTSAHKMFENCKSITTTYPLTFESLQDASFMFASSSTPHLEITSIPFTKVESMFEGAAQLEYAFIAEDIKIDEENTLKRIDNLSSANTLKNLFKGCINLSHPAKGFEAINAEVITREESQNIQTVPYHLNVSTATSLESAFEECTKMKFIDIYAPSATSIRSAFKNCTAIERLGLECPNLIDGKSAFEECYNLKEIDLKETFATGSTAKLINGENMFKGCSIKFKVDKTNCSWASLEIGNGMFSEMTVPTSIDVTKHLSFSDNWDFAKLVLGREMFKNTSIASVQMNLKKLQDGCGMFKNTNLTTIDTEIEKQLDSLVTALDMFSGCALDLDSVRGIVKCLKNNSGLTETNTTNKTFEPLLSNSAKALITNYDGTKYNDNDCIGVMTIDCNVADFGSLINNLAEFTTEIIEQTASSAHITVTNVNNAVWNVYINKNN